MPNCVTKFFTKKGTAFTETRGVVVQVEITDKITWDFYSGSQFTAFDGGVPYIIGEWKCDGDENFIITGNVTKRDGTKKNQTYNSKDDKWIDTVQTTQLDPAFDCVFYGLRSAEILFEIKDNLYIVASLGTGTLWYFYQPKPGTRPWVEVFNKKIISTGTWSCLGESNFQLTRSDGKTYVGGDTSWKGDTQADPTYDKSKFPLKLGSEGPEVAQLQNYLNKMIPSEPLVVNGIFDKKTQDKLIQHQRNLPL